MPQDKDIKKLVRARMVATGERYTQAKVAVDNRDEPVASGAKELLDNYERDWEDWLARISAEGRLGRNNARWRQDEPERPPLEAVKWGALNHPSPRMRAKCLNTLDHKANDESTQIFRAALADAVPRVRLAALHGLSCERCRSTELCVSDVVPDLVRTLDADNSMKVRHATARLLARFVARDQRVGEALGRAAATDADALVRRVAEAALEGRGRDIRTPKALRRRARRAAARNEAESP